MNLLQNTVARLTGKEASLFCASGTLSNQLAIRSHLMQPPYTVLCDSRAHILNYEATGISFHCGAGVIPVSPKEGLSYITADLVEQNLVVDDDIHNGPTQLICLENTLNGTIMPLEEVRKISAVAKRHNLPLHLDGARLWNATVATGKSLEEHCEPFDSVSLCFSKGMGAPIGSILVGSHKLIKKARHFRKLYGGGWRQAGMLASACLYSMENIWPLMRHDHDNAAFLASGLTNLGFALAYPAETNMVWVDASPLGLTADDLEVVFREHGIRMFGGSSTHFRWVIHHKVSREDVNFMLSIIKRFLDSKKEE